MNSLEVDVDSYDGRRGVFDKGLSKCKHCGRSNHVLEKFWEKVGWPEWAQLVDADTPASGDTTHAPVMSVAHLGSSGSSTVVLSQTEYNILCQFEVSQNSYSAAHASSSGIHAYTVSFQSPKF